MFTSRLFQFKQLRPYNFKPVIVGQGRYFSNDQYQERSIRDKRLKRRALDSTWVKLSPHTAVAIIFLMTSNAHLLYLPATSAAIHYLYIYNHLKKMTLYYDMQKLGTEENYVATFGAI